MYGLHLSKKYIKQHDICYIVEGYTDVLGMFQSSIKNVVANCGTALTKEQVRLVKRFTDNIVIIFDSDTAGINATLKAIDLFLEQDMNAEVIQLPKGEDPASFCSKNSKEMIDRFFLKNKTDFIEFKYSLRESNTSADTIKVIKSIIYSISLIQDNIIQAVYIKKAAKILHLSEEDIRLEAQSVKSTKKSHIKTNRQLKNLEEDKIDFKKIKTNHLEEFQLIRLFINHGSAKIYMLDGSHQTTSQFIINEIDADSISFSVPLFVILYNDVKNKNRKNDLSSKDYFLSHPNPLIAQLASYVIGDEPFLGSWAQKDIVVPEEKDLLSQVARESILRFKLNRVQSMRHEALERLKPPQASVEQDLSKFTKLNILEKKIQKELGRLC